MTQVITPWVDGVMASPEAARLQALARSLPGSSGPPMDIRANFMTTAQQRVDAGFKAMPAYQADRAAAEAAFARAMKVFGLF